MNEERTHQKRKNPNSQGISLENKTLLFRLMSKRSNSKKDPLSSKEIDLLRKILSFSEEIGSEYYSVQEEFLKYLTEFAFEVICAANPRIAQEDAWDLAGEFISWLAREKNSRKYGKIRRFTYIAIEFDPSRSSLKTYLSRILRNFLISEYRKKQKRRESALSSTKNKSDSRKYEEKISNMLHKQMFYSDSTNDFSFESLPKTLIERSKGKLYNLLNKIENKFGHKYKEKFIDYILFEKMDKISYIHIQRKYQMSYGAARTRMSRIRKEMAKQPDYFLQYCEDIAKKLRNNYQLLKEVLREIGECLMKEYYASAA